MQFPRRMLAISCTVVLLTITVLNPLAKTVYSAQFGPAQQEAANEDFSTQLAQLEGSRSSLDQQRLEDINRVLGQIQTGQETLHLIDEHEIDVRFELGGGSRFNPSRNQIIIDSRFGQYSAAVLLVHEATHARLFHQGLPADPRRDDRQTYVHRKLVEEANAIATSIEATAELWEMGVDITSMLPPMYYPYQQAYGSTVRAAKYDYPTLDEVTLQRIGRDAGLDVVLQAVIEGQVVTSTGQQTYMAYWGSVWDGTRRGTFETILQIIGASA